ncbi:MAG: histidine phosphatase family protein [Fimbriimonas sp.]|nr:histidine phosphatase family protein [Fimbriimonas sp.]
MLELVIVRHGESVRNHASDLAHHGDTTLLEYQLRFERDESSWDLTQRGIEQARTAGRWIRENIGPNFDLQYVSPFKRTRQTAACLELPGIDWAIDERLRERDWGDYSAPGMPMYSVEQYLQDLSLCGNVTWKREFPDAESVADMIPRCRSFLDDLFRRATSGQVVLVTHGGTMKSLELIIERLEIDESSRLAERHLTNCSVLHYRLSEFDETDTGWKGEVRFASPTTPDVPVSDWQPIATG